MIEKVADAVLDACRQYADTARAYAGERRETHTAYIIKDATDAILRALASPVSGDGSSLRDTHRAAEGAVVAVPDPACHLTGWSAKKIDGKWRVGMAGNLDTVHDARLTVHQHEELDGEAHRIADWIAATYTDAASRSPGMETLQASECTKHGEGDQ